MLLPYTNLTIAHATRFPCYAFVYGTLYSVMLTLQSPPILSQWLSKKKISRCL